LAVEHGLRELDARGPALQPRGAERGDEWLGQVRVDRDAGHEAAREAVAARGRVVVDLVVAVGGRVDGLDGVLRKALRHGAEFTAEPSRRWPGRTRSAA